MSDELRDIAIKTMRRIWANEGKCSGDKIFISYDIMEEALKNHGHAVAEECARIAENERKFRAYESGSVGIDKGWYPRQKEIAKAIREKLGGEG